MCLRNGPAYFAWIRVRTEEGLRRLRSDPRGCGQGPHRGCSCGSTPSSRRSCGLRLGRGGGGDDMHLRGRTGDEQARYGSHPPDEEGNDPAEVASGQVSRREFNGHPRPDIRADASGKEHQRQEKEAAQWATHGLLHSCRGTSFRALAIAPPSSFTRYDRTSSMCSPITDEVAADSSRRLPGCNRLVGGRSKVLLQGAFGR